MPMIDQTPNAPQLDKAFLYFENFVCRSASVAMQVYLNQSNSS